MSARARASVAEVSVPLTPAIDSPGQANRWWNRLGVELVWVAGMLVLYNVGRYIAKHHVGPAFDNAMQIWDFERWLRIPSEQAMQAAVMEAWPRGVEIANSYYATMHFPVTLAFLVWMFLRRPDHYLWIRRSLVILTSVALVGHLAFPLAPPRMLPELGFVDTGVLYDMSVYGADNANSLANQYAAMPSLHVAWAALVAVGLIVSTRTRWRWFWMIHPVITLGVVVITANHYWLDGVIGLILLAIALTVTIRSRPRRRLAAAEAAAAEPAATEAPEIEMTEGPESPTLVPDTPAGAQTAEPGVGVPDMLDTPANALDTPELQR